MHKYGGELKQILNLLSEINTWINILNKHLNIELLMTLRWGGGEWLPGGRGGLGGPSQALTGTRLKMNNININNYECLNINI